MARSTSITIHYHVVLKETLPSFSCYSFVTERMLSDHSPNRNVYVLSMLIFVRNLWKLLVIPLSHGVAFSLEIW